MAEENYFRELGRKVVFLSGSREQRPPPPGRASFVITFAQPLTALHIDIHHHQENISVKCIPP